MSLYDTSNLSEFIALLKSEQGDSDHTLGAKIGIAANTVNRLRHGAKADDDTLDKIAIYAGVTREWIYSLAKGTQVRPRYSRETSLLIALLEDAPSDIREEVLVLARALIGNRKKKLTKETDANSDLAGT